MAEYIRTLGAAVILAALTDMLVPEGSLRGCCRLACGFVVISAALSPFLSGADLTLPSYTAADTEAAEAEARARVLLRHKANLEEIIEAEFPGCEASVEVDGDGGVRSVTVQNAADEEAVRAYAERELGLERSEIKINEAEQTAAR